MTLQILTWFRLGLAGAGIFVAVAVATEAVARVARAGATLPRVRPWHRAAALVALAVLADSWWCWPAMIAELARDAEERGVGGAAGDTNASLAALLRAFLGSTSVILALAAAVFSARAVVVGVVP